MCTEIALRRGMSVWVNVEGIVGAGLHAGFAANADIGVKINDAIRAFVERRHRANSNTGSVFTMVAAEHSKVTSCIGEGAFFDVFHPGAVHA
jgi:hypothetical protein